MTGTPILIGAEPNKPPVMVEIVRSFSFKLNVGNYESRDFFCSQKAQCAMEESERVSEELHQFCQRQVQKAVAKYQAALENQAKKRDMERRTA